MPYNYFDGLKDNTGYPLYNRLKLTDDLANDMLGFDHPTSAWNPANIPGGAGNWSISLGGAGATLSSNEWRHWLRFYDNNQANPTYLEWTNAVAHNTLHTMVSIQARANSADGLLFEIRLWEAQAPGAATKYVCARWVLDRAGNSQAPIRFAWWYGTGVTFTATNGTMIGNPIPWQLGLNTRLWMYDTATPTLQSELYVADGLDGYRINSSSASYPAGFKTARWHSPNSRYDYFYIDDVMIA